MAVMQTSGASVRLGNRLGSGREILAMRHSVDFGFRQLCFSERYTNCDPYEYHLNGGY